MLREMMLKVSCLSKNNTLKMLASVLMSFAPPALAVSCEFMPSSNTQTVTYTIPSNLTVPRDAPVGYAVWTSDEQTIGDQHSWWICTGKFKHGLVNEVGGAASADKPKYLPIGETGLAWWWDAGYFDYGNTSDGGGGAMSFGTIVKRLKIIKIGPVKAGASVPAGTLGHLSANKDINIFTIKTSNKSSVAMLSCKTPDITVKMGDQNYVGRFKGVGTSLAPVKFSIALKECPEGINKVSYQLNPNTDIVDATRSVVALDAGSTAKGVGLQLLDNAGNPVALKAKLQFSAYDKLGGNFNIPLKAAYHQTGSEIVPGTANGSVTFVMSYD